LKASHVPSTSTAYRYPLSTEANPEESKCTAFQDKLGNAMQYHLWSGTGFMLPSGCLWRAEGCAVETPEAAFMQTAQSPVDGKDLVTQKGGQQMRPSLIDSAKHYSYLHAAS